MVKENGTGNILLMQLSQSKGYAVLLIIFTISYFGRVNSEWSGAFDYLFYGSGYFLLYLFSIALTTAVHERGHIVKLKELGFEPSNFKANRIGDVSFWIANMNQMSANESYENAAAPFLAPISYISEIVTFLIILWLNILSPYPLNLLLFLLTFLAFISLIGSFCATYTVRMRKTSGFCVILARTITSRGDINEIVTWNKMNRTRN